MRFFTMAWWLGVQEATVQDPENSDPSSAYFAHLATLRERTPAERIPTLNALESVPLHDSRLRELRFASADGSLRITLENYDGNERFTLIYYGVEQWMSVADPNTGLGGPYGYGDLGYDEIDLAPNESFVHNLLFSSGIELEIIFREFEFLTERRNA